MATSVQYRKQLTLLATLLLAFWPMLNSVLITDEGKITTATVPLVGGVGKKGNI